MTLGANKKLSIDQKSKAFVVIWSFVTSFQISDESGHTHCNCRHSRIAYIFSRPPYWRLKPFYICAL